jgi:hypothetical protein
MSSEAAETHLSQNKREARREASSPARPAQPVCAPFLSDGIEQVRDSHC